MSAEKMDPLYPRAPRYVVQLDDNQVVRFAAFPKGSQAMHTRIINLSESGMAFLLPLLDNPKVDDVIKVEFQPPGSQAIACFAKVVRVENHKSFDSFHSHQRFKLVAVTFLELPDKQRRMLAEALGKKFVDLRKRYRREQWMRKVQWMLFKAYQFFLSFFSRSSAKRNDEPQAIKMNKYIDED
ncbi:MAG: PilZ domain-containing protein [Bdellovibrionales bacterium]|nr:PilZ domain-containing protein [Bdellovibrionales bacterium]